MAIDRGPWTALVDDDGSNLVGSIWNKAAIKTVILDPTDTAIAPPWVAIPHNAANYTAAAGAWTVSAANQITLKYVVVGKTAYFTIMIDASTNTASTARLFLTLPADVPRANFPMQVPLVYYHTAGAGTGYVEIAGGNPVIGFLRDILGTAWAASTNNMFLRAQWFYEIA